MRIIVLDGYTLNPGDLSWEEIEELGELTVYSRTETKNILQRSKDAEIILTNKTPLSSDLINQLPNLKYIGVLATGYNVVDVRAACKRGITVCNIPAYSTESVAQMVFAHILAITNHVEYYTEKNRQGQWCQSADFCYWDAPLTELASKKIGIIGLGNIGKAVARIAIAFGMKVYAYTSKPQSECGNDIEKSSLDDLFVQCDIISLHCPLTEDTKCLINEKRLASMKPSAILINTGRGALVDEQAVADALNSGRIAAFGCDVLNTEPAQSHNPLLTAKNIYITPHIAWATVEARQRLMKICAANIRAFLEGKPQNVVSL